jgi:hypothetical protein
VASRPVRGLSPVAIVGLVTRAAVAVACTVMLAGCSAGGGGGNGGASGGNGGGDHAAALPSAPPGSGTTTSVPGESATVTPGTPDAAALAATAAWLAYDTRVDRRPNDTARRLALPWLAPAMRRQILAFTSSADAGADWAQWSGRHAHATVEPHLGSDDHPPDDDGTAWRQVVATVTLHGDGGWTSTLQRTVFVQLSLVDGHWLVTDLQTTDG